MRGDDQFRNKDISSHEKNNFKGADHEKDTLIACKVSAIQETFASSQ